MLRAIKLSGGLLSAKHSNQILSNISTVRNFSAFGRDNRSFNQSPRSTGSHEVLEDLFLGLADRKNFDYEKYKKAAIEVKGNDVPPAVSEWKAMNLDKKLMENIQEAGFGQPILVQQHAMPILMAKRDVMICAQTGSGKTAAFLFPIITSLKAERVAPPMEKTQGYIQFTPYAVVIAPTRELAQQIHSEAVQFSRGTGIYSACVFGGSPVMSQLQNMQSQAPHILIATPGRLHDMLDRGYLSLKNVKMLVLDEADRMLDMGFEPQIRKIIEDADMTPKDKRNTTMFSATFPREIRELAKRFLRPDHLFLSVGKVGQTAELVQQNFVKVDHPNEKITNLVELIKNERGSTLVFVQTKRDVEGISFQLNSAGVNAEVIHGDRSQAQRNAALNRFAKGSVNVLIATNVAARGIDFKGVAHVINFDLPQDMDDYVHRIGRTGRAGKAGKATTLISHNDPTDSLRKLEELLVDAKQAVPQWLQSIQGGRSRAFGGNRGGAFGGGRGNAFGGFSSGGRGGFGGRGGVQFGSPRGSAFRGGDSDRASSYGDDRGSNFGGRRDRGDKFGSPSGNSFRKGNNNTVDDFDWSIFDEKK